MASAQSISAYAEDTRRNHCSWLAPPVGCAANLPAPAHTTLLLHTIHKLLLAAVSTFLGRATIAAAAVARLHGSGRKLSCVSLCG